MLSKKTLFEGVSVPKIYMMRGIAGSGKTTFVQKNMGIGDFDCSVDSFFVDGSGRYNFRHELLDYAVMKFKDKFKRGVKLNRNIFVDTCNIKIEDVQWCLDNCGDVYDVLICEMHGELSAQQIAAFAQRSLHSISSFVNNKKYSDFIENGFGDEFNNKFGGRTKWTLIHS